MSKTYYEVVVNGTLDLVKGFVIGFLEGRGIRGETFFGGEYQVEDDSPLDFLMHLIGSGEEESTVVVEAGLHEMLYSALKNRQDEINLEVASIREIIGASFDFSYKTFSRETGQQLLHLFSELPAGATTNVGYKPHEKSTPEGEGVDAYAPLHNYELKAKGRVSGTVKDIFEMHRKAEHYEVVELGDIKLTYGKKIT